MSCHCGTMHPDYWRGPWQGRDNATLWGVNRDSRGVCACGASPCMWCDEVAHCQVARQCIVRAYLSDWYVDRFVNPRPSRVQSLRKLRAARDVLWDALEDDTVTADAAASIAREVLEAGRELELDHEYLHRTSVRVTKVTRVVMVHDEIYTALHVATPEWVEPRVLPDFRFTYSLEWASPGWASPGWADAR